MSLYLISLVFLIPQPDLIDDLGPLRVILKEPLAEDLKLLTRCLFTQLSSYGCDELVEGSQSDDPARLLTECCLTLVRGSSRAHRVAVEALGSPAESGEDVDVGMGS